MTEPTDNTTQNEQFKYVPTTPRDKAWGLAVTTIGYRCTVPFEENANTLHPNGYNFSTDGRRVLNEYQLVYITRGRGYFESASCSKTKTDAGTMFMLFPGEWHSFTPDPTTGWDLYWVGFNGNIMDEKIKCGFFTFKNCIFRIGVDEQIVNTYHHILDIVNYEKKGYQQLASALAFSLIGRVYYENINHSFENGFLTNVINQAKAVMKKDLNGEQTLEDIAASLGIGYSLFRREFKRACGVSPGQYRIELKMEKAKELLYSTNMSVAQIARSLQFDCLGQFSTFFKKRTGLTPLEFRKHSIRNI